MVTRMLQEWGNVGLLCSDGLTRHVSDERIRDRLQLDDLRQAGLRGPAAGRPRRRRHRQHHHHRRPPGSARSRLAPVPELPDIVVYLESLRPRVLGQRLDSIRIINPFTLRSFEPPIGAAEGKAVVGIRRMGKRLVLELDGQLFLVIHLMIAGRLRWRPPGGKPPGKPALAAFTFPTGTLVLTEAGSKRRASIHLVAGPGALAEFERGGLEVLESDLSDFFRPPASGTSHAQAVSHRPTTLQRHRERVLGRDPASCQALATRHERPVGRRGSGHPVPGDT